MSWNTLGGYLNWLEKKGMSCNIASFVGTGTIRTYVIGEDNAAPTPAQMDSMRLLVAQAMEEGAMGITNALIYPPDFFQRQMSWFTCAKRPRNMEACTPVISAVKEINYLKRSGTDHISREAGIPVEIYHLKEAGKDNWWKLDSLVKICEAARKEGLPITADMYTYNRAPPGLRLLFRPPCRMADLINYGNVYRIRRSVQR